METGGMSEYDNLKDERSRKAAERARKVAAGRILFACKIAARDKKVGCSCSEPG